MHTIRNWSILACAVLTLAIVAWAESRKAGLYEVTTTMTWQQSPFPGGMGPGGRAPRTTQVCVTQAQIDKYDGVPPQTRGDCQISNIVKNANGFTADVACTGQMSSKGTVEATYDGEGHGTTKVHLTGTMMDKPVEMTLESHSIFKSSDCGNVQPAADK